MSGLPPDCAEKYDPVTLLGTGGHGAVLLCEHRELKRRVAVKVLHTMGRLPADAISRLVEEARVTSKLRHPNIVHLLDYGAESGTPWLAYEYLEGESLERRLRDGPIPWRDAVSIGREVARALEAAHALDVVHRDIKPENLVRTADGSWKVIDFGVARWSSSSVKTAAGVVLGTPAYMSPEALRGETPGPRFDLYALGVVLFQMIAGRLPFAAARPEELVRKHLRETPPRLRTIRPEVPPAVEEVVATCLAKDARRSYGSAAELSRALEASERPGARVPRAGRPGSFAIVGVAAGLAVLGSAVIFVTRPESPPATPPAPPVSASALPIAAAGGLLDALGVDFRRLIPLAEAGEWPAERRHALQKLGADLADHLDALTARLDRPDGGLAPGEWVTFLTFAGGLADRLLALDLLMEAPTFRFRSETWMDSTRQRLRGAFARLTASLAAARHGPASAAMSRLLGSHLVAAGPDGRPPPSSTVHSGIADAAEEAARALRADSVDSCLAPALETLLLSHAKVHVQQTSGAARVLSLEKRMLDLFDPLEARCPEAGSADVQREAEDQIHHLIREIVTRPAPLPPGVDALAARVRRRLATMQPLDDGYAALEETIRRRLAEGSMVKPGPSN